MAEPPVWSRGQLFLILAGLGHGLLEVRHGILGAIPVPHVTLALGCAGAVVLAGLAAAPRATPRGERQARRELSRLVVCAAAGLGGGFLFLDLAGLLAWLFRLAALWQTGALAFSWQPETLREPVAPGALSGWWGIRGFLEWQQGLSPRLASEVLLSGMGGLGVGRLLAAFSRSLRQRLRKVLRVVPWLPGPRPNARGAEGLLNPVLQSAVHGWLLAAGFAGLLWLVWPQLEVSSGPLSLSPAVWYGLAPGGKEVTFQAYGAGTWLYTWQAQTNLRAEPTREADLLGTLPHGSGVKVVAVGRHTERLEERAGLWYGVTRLAPPTPASRAKEPAKKVEPRFRHSAVRKQPVAVARADAEGEDAAAPVPDGYIFGGLLTPAHLEGDLDGDGRLEGITLAVTDDFQGRVAISRAATLLETLTIPAPDCEEKQGQKGLRLQGRLLAEQKLGLPVLVVGSTRTSCMGSSLTLVTFRPPAGMTQPRLLAWPGATGINTQGAGCTIGLDGWFGLAVLGCGQDAGIPGRAGIAGRLQPFSLRAALP